MDKLKEIVSNEKVRGLIAIAAAVIMYYTPAHVDAIIETLLAALGVQKLILKDKD